MAAGLTFYKFQFNFACVLAEAKWISILKRLHDKWFSKNVELAMEYVHLKIISLKFQWHSIEI
jgi:hypothetical protein